MPPKKKASAGGGPATKKAKIQPAEAPTQEDLKKQTVATLKETCTQLGLDGKGTKDSLIKKILEHHETADQIPGVKLVKQESQNTQIRKAFESLKNEVPASKSAPKLDEHYWGSTTFTNVYEDYACTLNQTNIGHNNNKFYIIQLVASKISQKADVNYIVFTRWGRVGEIGQMIMSKPLPLDNAIREYKKKFKDKTKNDWDDRQNFVSVKGKYALLEMDDGDSEEETEVKLKKPELVKGELTAPCTLDSKTKDLVQLLFDKEMFNNAMLVMELDVRKMPLGKISKSQIAKGFEVLIAMEEAIRDKKGQQVLAELSSQFYTLIPHNFGRRIPTVLSTPSLVQQKKDVLLVLSDIELTQSLQKTKDSNKSKSEEALKPHPVDVDYRLMNCILEILSPKSKEYQVIQKYYTNTKPTYGKHSLREVWIVDRNGEDSRFSQHKSVKNRKLLWHGTNVAVVAAILTTGLRIMPHSGGRVGSGIYFASENSKSACYVQCAPNGHGLMFLNEVVLGQEKSITADNSSLKAAPKGFHSVVARGRKEPDSKLDTTIDINGNKIIVPQGKAVPTQYENSSFDQSEYLVYDESQVRIRYLLLIEMKR